MGKISYGIMSMSAIGWYKMHAGTTPRSHKSAAKASEIKQARACKNAFIAYLAECWLWIETVLGPWLMTFYKTTTTQIKTRMLSKTSLLSAISIRMYIHLYRCRMLVAESPSPLMSTQLMYVCVCVFNCMYLCFCLCCLCLTSRIWHENKLSRFLCYQTHTHTDIHLFCEKASIRFKLDFQRILKCQNITTFVPGKALKTHVFQLKSSGLWYD